MTWTRRFPFLNWRPTAFLYFHHSRAWAGPPSRSAVRRFRGGPTFQHPDRPPARRGPALGQVGVHMLVALCLAVVCWNLQAARGPLAPVPTGFDLRTEVASSKLNTTSAEAVARPTEPPLQIKLDKQQSVELQPVSTPLSLPVFAPPPVVPVAAAEVSVPQLEPPAPLPPPVPMVAEIPLPVPPPIVPLPVVVEAPPVGRPLAGVSAVAAAEGSAALQPPTGIALSVPPRVELEPYSACPRIFVRHPGDTPMLRNWKLYGVTTLLTFALATPAPAQQDGPPQEDQFTKLEKQIKSFEKSVAKAFADSFDDAKELRKEIAAIKDSTTKTQLNLQTALKRIETLETQMSLLKVELDGMRSNGNRLYPSDAKDQFAELKSELLQLRQAITKYTPQPAVTTAGTGQLVVTNRYGEEILLVVNGAEQGRIPANSSRVIQGLPVGVVTYEIISTWGSSGIRRSTVTGGDPLRVNVQ